MDRDQNVVEFSVGKVRLTNDGRDHQKATFYVQNRCSASRKIRAAVAKHSDPVRSRNWTIVWCSRLSLCIDECNV